MNPVGDVIGVVVVAPLVLIAFARPREIWRRRALPVALPLMLLLILATSLGYKHPGPAFSFQRKGLAPGPVPGLGRLLS
jgi:hypothetical protein